jgi:bacteriocin-like protein
MNNPQDKTTQELTAQELASVSGGAYDPHGEKPSGGVYDPHAEQPSLSEVVDQKLKEYSKQYGYPYSYPYNSDSQS